MNCIFNICASAGNYLFGIRIEHIVFLILILIITVSLW